MPFKTKESIIEKAVKQILIRQLNTIREYLIMDFTKQNSC